jgi:hypothetical protein
MKAGVFVQVKKSVRETDFQLSISVEFFPLDGSDHFLAEGLQTTYLLFLNLVKYPNG